MHWGKTVLVSPSYKVADVSPRLLRASCPTDTAKIDQGYCFPSRPVAPLNFDLTEIFHSENIWKKDKFLSKFPLLYSHIIYSKKWYMLQWIVIYRNLFLVSYGCWRHIFYNNCYYYVINIISSILIKYVDFGIVNFSWIVIIRWISFIKYTTYCHLLMTAQLQYTENILFWTVLKLSIERKAYQAFNALYSNKLYYTRYHVICLAFTDVIASRTCEQ